MIKFADEAIISVASGKGAMVALPLGERDLFPWVAQQAEMGGVVEMWCLL